MTMQRDGASTWWQCDKTLRQNNKTIKPAQQAVAEEAAIAEEAAVAEVASMAASSQQCQND